MKIFLPNQQGFAPAILLIILAAVGVTGVGTVAASNASNPGDVLFGLDKAAEELRVTFFPGDEAKAKIRLEIAEERLEELQALENNNQPVTPAVVETQQALNNATVAVNNVEVKFKENKIKLRSTDLQSLLTELQALLATHQGLIRRVEIKIEDGEVRAKIKLFEQEATESAELIDDDLDDLEDDGLLNASQMLKIKLKGTLVNTGAGFQITHGGKTYTLTAGAGINLATFAGKLVELKGFANNDTPTQVTVTKIELEDEIEDDEEELEVEGLPEVEAKGFIRSSGGGFTLTFNGETILYTLASTKVNLSSFVGKFAEVEGVLSGNVLQVHEVEVKKIDSSGKPVAPALQQSPASDDNDEDDDDDNSNSGSSGSNSGSGSSGSNSGSGSGGNGSSGSGEDESDDD